MRSARSRVDWISLLSCYFSDNAEEGLFEPAHGNLKDVAETAQHLVGFTSLAPVEPRVGTGIEGDRQDFLFSDEIFKRTRKTESSNETTARAVRVRSGKGKARRTCCGRSPAESLAEPDAGAAVEMSTVSPAIDSSVIQLDR